MGFKEKLIKSSSISETALLEQSTLWDDKQMVITSTPAINIALGGALDGGMSPGIVQIAGDSKMFKSKYAIYLAGEFQKTFPEGIVLFYDSEFGTPRPYFNDLDRSRIVHTPVVNLEKLRSDLAIQLDQVDIKSGDKLFIIIDSLGNIPTVKELKDAKDEKEVADMTRAKVIKSVFRIMGPQLVLKEVYVVVVNHSYQTMELYPTEVASGGRGSIYNSNTLWIITSSKNKEDSELVGFNFNITVKKSRKVKQEARIPITVTFEEGIDRWSGLLDMAVESGHVVRPTKQTYALASKPEVTFKKKDLDDEFYNYLIKDQGFIDWVRKEYTLS